MLKTSPDMEPYLSLPISAYDRFLLTRFRLNLFHLLLAVPRESHKGKVLASCGCDNKSPQDLLHFTFLCKYYEMPISLFLKPILKKLNFRHIRPALFYLQLLNPKCVPFVAVFLKSAMKCRKSLDF